MAWAKQCAAQGLGLGADGLGADRTGSASVQITVTVRTTRLLGAHDAGPLSSAEPMPGLSDQKLEDRMKVRLDVMRFAERDLHGDSPDATTDIQLREGLLKATNTIQLTANPIHLIT